MILHRYIKNQITSNATSVTCITQLLNYVIQIVDKLTNYNDLLEKDFGTKNCIYKD